MNNFIYHNPTKLVFGKGQIARLPKLIPAGKRIMLTFGGGSVKRNGVYDQVVAALEGRDLMGCAQTGTGKTAAFTLPILQLLAAEPRTKGRRTIKALVLTPTRELAAQIDECCRDYARYTDIRHCVIFGGVNQRPQVDALQRGIDLLVATPGRLLDLIGQGYVSLSDIRFFVLDEADRMLDMGFIHDIRRILPLLPERRQTLFFSATIDRKSVV